MEGNPPHSNSDVQFAQDERSKERLVAISGGGSVILTQLASFQMVPIMNECAGVLTEVLEEKVGTPFDIYGYFQGLTLDVISRCALALQLDCQRKPDVIQSKRKLPC